MAVLNTKQLADTLLNVGARWEATEPAGEYALGYVPGPDDHSLEERESISNASNRRFMALASTAGAAPAYPPAIDWRQFPGLAPLPAGNYVTAVRDQGTCGSCVAFGALAAFESAIKIKATNPATAIDLSEADLFYCHGEAEAGRSCGGPNGGWWPDKALAYCQSPGIVDESCFPYTSGDQPCNRCGDWKKRLKKILKWHKVVDPTDMKQWLATRGPLLACFSVYADFYSYRSGIYQHVSGAFQGGHCVCCIGYDDAQRYWICKNSWNTAWGDQGFFKVEYGQVGIDATMWAIEL
jgi:C1A family cysteine protease